ncbi:MAG: ABC transporter ATP-binding protein [Treponema sp.]|nr:ABC transporter ATP-binding protein [Treponema sp.]
MIELRGVSFSYPESPALRSVDLSVAEGESVAVIGPNGSGKSTLLKLICGLEAGFSGAYAFGGEPITASRLADARFSKDFHKRIGLLFQDSDVQLFCGSVYDELAFGPRQMGLGEDEVSRRVAELVGLFGLERHETRVPYHLSGGEKRKVALASVLSLAPDAICFDEPMNGLDPKTKRYLRDLMVSLNANGMTLLCATHDFEYVDGVFGRAVVMSQDGRLVRDGPYAEVLADRPFLAEMNIV